jgi:hypothetical protein
MPAMDLLCSILLKKTDNRKFINHSTKKNMQITKKIKQKLDLNNSKKYIDGYYQLSKKQQSLWVAMLFGISMVFIILRFLQMGAKSSFVVTIISMFIASFLLMIISFVPAFMWSWIDGKVATSFFRSTKKQLISKNLKDNLRVRKIVFYQLWTAFLVLTIIAIFLKIPLQVINPIVPKI